MLKTNMMPIQNNFVKKALSTLCLGAMLFAGSAALLTQDADARPRYRGYSGYDRGYDRRDRPMFSYKTGKILKGGLVGAGVGAGTAVVLDKPLLKTTVLGAGIGAGVQAIRYW
ncbi:MAG: hypothetical protein VKJ04_01220 [Vampirovibrionales bacterium]|nr:hypothetical protein [Vampirovibrionales bacterium]